MRRPLLTVTALAATLVLAGCGDEAEPSATPTPTPTPSATAGDNYNAEPTAEDVAALEAVTVEGAVGAEPTVTFETPFDVSASVARIDVPGTGDVLETGQMLVVDFVVLDGASGDPIASTWEQQAPQTFALGDPTLPAAMNDVLADQQVGVRFLVGVPPAQAVDGQASAASIIVFEVVSTVPGRATGTAVEPPAGLPQVTLADDGTPSVEIGDAAEPTSLVAETLIRGEGPEVVVGDLLTVHYTGWLWDGTSFDSSWGGTPLQTVIGAGQVIPGWDQGLVGQTVGSQVLLVIPAELGYGEEGTGSIPGGATLVFVVDILAAGSA